MTDVERETMVCTTFHRHPAHDWDYDQDWGGSKTFHYRCPGIEKIVITTIEDGEVIR